jgi:NAD(P)-dependent dehydrogenase (short-subunit alcohol dehydrogenase family)
MNRVDGKVAIVSGAARGIGAETAALLAKAGAKVVITDTRAELGEATADRIARDGGQAMFLRHDVTSESDWERVTSETTRRFGALNILVNNAGIYSYAKLEEMDVGQYDTLCNVNLKGVFLGTKHAIRAMKATPKTADSASIVNLSSVAGLVGSPLSAIYSMTKGGVRLLTKSTALEVAQLGYHIRCNSIHPGVIDTDMAGLVVQRWEAAGMGSNEIRGFLTNLHPVGRLGQPIDIARGILFLASNDSAFMTGTELVVDGGWTAR